MVQNLKTVLRIEDDEKSINWQWSDEFTSEMKSISICSLEYDVPSLIKNGTLAENVKEGDTFIKSPFDEKYVQIAEYENTVMQDKANHLAEIARLLGAQHVDYSIEIVEMKIANWQTNAKSGCNYAEVDVSIKKECQEKLEKSISVASEYSNAHVPTTEDYDRAVSYAKEHNLYIDSEVRNLIMARNPIENNMLSSKTVSLNLSSELNSNLDIAVNLNLMNSVFKLDWNFTQATQYRKTAVIKLNYNFAMP